MGIVWFLVVLSIAAFSSTFLFDNFHPPVWVLWIYAWIPGGLGLLWSRIKKINIPLFPKNKLYLLWSLLGGFAIGAFSFFMSQGFFATTPYPSFRIEHAVIYFFSYYILITLSLCLLFIGGEFCWRGYLWQRWKRRPFKGGVAIWLLWSMWLAPETIFFSKSIFSMAFFNFSLMPFLHYFRLKSQSITPGTIFYSSICASAIYFQILFSSTQELPRLSITQGAILIVIAITYILVNKGKRFL